MYTMNNHQQNLINHVMEPPIHHNHEEFATNPAKKRKLSPSVYMRQAFKFKKAIHPSQIKNLEFTLARQRERRDRELHEYVSSDDDSYRDEHIEDVAESPIPNGYEQILTQQQLAFLHAQRQQQCNIGDFNAIQRQQLLMRTGIPNMVQFPPGAQQFLPHQPDQQLPPGHVNVLQWHTRQFCKNLLGNNNAVNRMLEQLNNSREVEEVRPAVECPEDNSNDQQGQNLFYEEGVSSSEEGETSDEESDEINNEGYYVEPPIDIEAHNNYVFQFNRQVMEMANRELQTSQLVNFRAEQEEAQTFCDGADCDRNSEQMNGVVEEGVEKMDTVPDENVICDLKCDCKLSSCSPNKKHLNNSCESVVNGNVASVRDSSPKSKTKYNSTSPIKNIPITIKTDLGYPRA